MTTNREVKRFRSVGDLSDPSALAEVTGPIVAIERVDRPSGRFSGSELEWLDVQLVSGERRRLVLKRVHPNRAWTAYRTGDHSGREALLLAEDALAGVRDIFANPALAFALEPGEAGVLMTDLSAHLPPDVDEPLLDDQEGQLLGALARLHARFWQHGALGLPWLAQPASLFGLLGPAAPAEEARRSQPHPFFEAVREGWKLALQRLPAGMREMFCAPARTLAGACDGLPRTLLHGDAKVANFAFLPDGRVAAFDWALAGAGPATLDLGWYLAVNAGRLTQSKEAIIDRYRGLLEAALGGPIAQDLWQGMLDAGLFCASLMLLWEKALALEAKSFGAEEEWAWWVRQLQRQHQPEC